MNLLTHFACLDCRDPFLQGSRFLMMINSKHKFYAGKIQIILFSVCVCVCVCVFEFVPHHLEFGQGTKNNNIFLYNIKNIPHKHLLLFPEHLTLTWPVFP